MKTAIIVVVLLLSAAACTGLLGLMGIHGANPAGMQAAEGKMTEGLMEWWYSLLGIPALGAAHELGRRSEKKKQRRAAVQQGRLP